MESEDDLDILTALLAESEDIGADEKEEAEDFDGLFDNDDEGDVEYKEGIEEEEEEEEAGVGNDNTVSELFGDVDDIEEETEDNCGRATEEEAIECFNKSKEDLQEELRRMQEKMQRLQQQLEASQSAASTPSTPVRITATLGHPKPRSPSQGTSREATSKPSIPARMTATLGHPKLRSPSHGPSKEAAIKPTLSMEKTRVQAVKPSSNPVREEGIKLQESGDFLAQLSNADSFKRKSRLAHQSKTSTSPESRGPLVEIKIGSSFQPMKSTMKVSEPLHSPLASQSNPGSAPPKARQTKALPPPPAPKDVALEKYSGLRLRRPRVSSTEMDRKMADRRLIRLSQVPERLAREKLEDSDWVTFAVVVNKVTPQSHSSGKTFSIWKLNDLHNLEVFVSLLLFGEVHKEHWKTELGTVIGLLNPNPMKQKDGYDGVSLSVDHPQKVLLIGEAQDYGTCKAMKKNGDPCSQIVNLYECQYCQYHVKAQYQKMSSKRADLQSSYSGKAPGRGRGGATSLKERLCQDGFHYGGVSSAACAASLNASKPNKPVQRTLDKLFVSGAAQLVNQAKKLVIQSGNVAGCTDEFKDLMSLPSPGALQLKKHLSQVKTSGSQGPVSGEVQSISASELLKLQKSKQQELLEARRRRAEDIHNKVLQSRATARPGPSRAPGSSALLDRGLLVSPKAASEVPKATNNPSVPKSPMLGRGFTEGEDILFFDHNPSPPPTSLNLSATKEAALKKLRAKGKGLVKEDPNAVKRKRSDVSDINSRVEKSLVPPEGESSVGEEEEPAQKKRREQLQYIQSKEFQKILNSKSRHSTELQAAEYQLQEHYFAALVKKEQMEEKMKGIREMKCRAVTCRKCKYTYFKPADRCIGENHDLRWHDAMKRFFKCPCGQRAIALDRLPHKHCSNCGLFKWERDGMLKEKMGPKIAGELLLPRGEEQPKFLNSMK